MSNDVDEAKTITKELQSILDEPGWTEEQWRRMQDKAQELVPIQKRLEDCL